MLATVPYPAPRPRRPVLTARQILATRILAGDECALRSLAQLYRQEGNDTGARALLTQPPHYALAHAHFLLSPRPLTVPALPTNA